MLIPKESLVAIAFVNEPAEDTARITLDETGNAVEFMADQARMSKTM